MIQLAGYAAQLCDQSQSGDIPHLLAFRMINQIKTNLGYWQGCFLRLRNNPNNDS